MHIKHHAALLTLLTGTILTNNPAYALPDVNPDGTPAQHISASDPMKHADRDMKKVLDALAGLHGKPIETLTPREARKQPTPADAVAVILKEKGMDPNDPRGVATKDITIDASTGKLAARIYTPMEYNHHLGLPIVLYFHGGGFVIADKETYDAGPRALAKDASVMVISVDYREAPEHKFPAAHNDAFAAYQWVVENADRLGGDPQLIAVMGESAGANLAINTAIEARRHDMQMPMYQVLIYPVAGVNMQTPSYLENANAKPLNKAMMKWFFKETLRSDKDRLDPRLDLVERADLHGLPPATVITAQIDPLRSEGVLLAEKLKRAGVKVDAKNYKGVTHEFYGMGAVVDTARDAEKRVADDLKTAFGR